MILAAFRRRVKPYRCVECLAPNNTRGLCSYCWHTRHDRATGGMMDWGLRPQIDERPQWVRIQ